jgi:hypothetical protein
MFCIPLTISSAFHNLHSISFRKIAFVLSHYEDFFDFAMNFMLCYAWRWESHSIYTSPACFEKVFYFQFHIRYIVLDPGNGKTPKTSRPGIQLMRESGQIPGLDTKTRIHFMRESGRLPDVDTETRTHFIREGRASIAIAIPLATPVPAFYSILSFAENISEPDIVDLPFGNTGKLTGMHFVLWRIEHILDQCLIWWKKILDALDAELRVTVGIPHATSDILRPFADWTA